MDRGRKKVRDGDTCWRGLHCVQILVQKTLKEVLSKTSGLNCVATCG